MLMFQDDISHDSSSLLDARVTNYKMDMIMKTKQLELNRDKTVLVVMGRKEQKEQVAKELLQNPLMCGTFKMKEVEAEKWLGDYISSGGLGASVLATVEAREGKVKGACLEVAAIVEDWRAQVAGGFESGLMLWETCCLPSLLHNAGTWVEMPATALKKLNSLQGWFLRLLLRQGPGVPSCSLLWESCLWDMELHVWLAKLMMIMHIRGLKEDSLAKQVWREQRLMAWPGLAQECDTIAEKLSIENANETLMSKKEYRASVTRACDAENERRLRQEMEGKEKCKRIRLDDYGRKEYFSEKTPSQTREMFATRLSMHPWAGNFSNDRRFARTGWLCRCGGSVEREEHVVTSCPMYADLRGSWGDLGEDANLAGFFREALARRDEYDREEKKKEQEKQNE